MKLRRSMLKDAVTVQTYGGEGAYGPVLGAAVTVACNVDSRRRLVRNAVGEEVVSGATLAVHSADASLFTPESVVTIDARTSRVLDVRAHTFRGMAVWSEVACA